MLKTVFHKTRYKDGKPVTDPKEKGGEETHERYRIDAIDAHDAVARFPKHYSFDHPGEGAKIVDRTSPTPFNAQMVETGDGSTPPPGAVAVEDSEAPNDEARAAMTGFSPMDDPVNREPLVGGGKKNR